MPIRVSNIRVSIDESEETLGAHIAAAISVRPGDIARVRILRKSLDVRDKHDLRFVYTAEVVLPADEDRLLARLKKSRPGLHADRYVERRYELPSPGGAPLAARPVIVGSGPAGLAAAFYLAQAGYRPLVIERGRAVRDRIRDVKVLEEGGPHDPESNYLFGEGGAGTFSDGKLTCRLSGPEVQQILELFAAHKGKPSIIYEQRPHLGSNRLPAVVKSLRQDIIALGGEFLFSCRVEDLDLADGAIRGVHSSSGYIPASVVILAIGHSARDTYEMLVQRNVPMTHKPFQLGVRIEQPQEQVNRVQYGAERLEDRLGAADYTLVAKGQHDVFTFCMCAGGQVIPSVSEPGYFSTNGMSLSRRDTPFANSGLMVTLTPEHFGGTDLLAGVRLQRHYEAIAYRLGGPDYHCPIQTAYDFLSRSATTSAPPSSYRRGLAPTDLRHVLPPIVIAALEAGLPQLDHKWRGKFLANATLVGPEARGSSPVRITRDPVTLESPAIAGFYPIGEGAGFAGGIVSAAVDGLRAAAAVIRKYARVG